MSQLLIPDVDEAILMQLRERAAHNARSVEAEAVSILTAVLQPSQDPWAAVRAIHARLKATGRDFGDSVEIIREERNR